MPAQTTPVRGAQQHTMADTPMADTLSLSVGRAGRMQRAALAERRGCYHHRRQCCHHGVTTPRTRLPLRPYRAPRSAPQAAINNQCCGLSLGHYGKQRPGSQDQEINNSSYGSPERSTLLLCETHRRKHEQDCCPLLHQTVNG
jgi:hypothetical protein